MRVWAEDTQILYTQDDIDDILKLGRAFVQIALSSIKASADREVSEAFVEVARKTASNITDLCEELQKALSGEE